MQQLSMNSFKSARFDLKTLFIILFKILEQWYLFTLFYQSEEEFIFI